MGNNWCCQCGNLRDKCAHAIGTWEDEGGNVNIEPNKRSYDELIKQNHSLEREIQRLKAEIEENDELLERSE